jgi:mRNA interferase RelE/StbE
VKPHSRRLNVPDEIARLVRSLNPDLKRKVKSSLRIILNDPGSGKALKDELAGLRSFRVGKFRIIYRVPSGNLIDIVAIGPRVRIYEETYRLLRKEPKEKTGKRV